MGLMAERGAQRMQARQTRQPGRVAILLHTGSIPVGVILRRILGQQPCQLRAIYVALRRLNGTILCPLRGSYCPHADIAFPCIHKHSAAGVVI
jgi:hypothetical protein